ncbi:MAG: ADP-ribosylglycohydrolase family protein [Armatimonadetes bacterium]|nr:ADP-ribosylglycohydrolase family protein [Armatimonadota bacterium]
MRHLLLLLTLLTTTLAGAAERRLPLADYLDHMKGGWVGQIAGVCWGAPTEFRFGDKIIPEEAMPKWQPKMINDAFGQDDLYVEMTFLRTMEEHGLDCSIRQAGIDFANSRYPLWCANDAGRKNLRSGIAPPDSSHPKFNRCPNDIDYQIEADFSGLIAPGLPNVAVALGEKFGRLMNYGDGLYAGQFIGACYAEAFFEPDVRRIIEAGLKAIPAQSQYAEMVRDMLAWSRDIPDWQACWQRIQAKYRQDPAYQKASNGGIDCKVNGAYVLLGLLYGKGDIDQTIVIACRGGQDSDCNPSSAAGILCASLGFAKMPARFTQQLDEKPIFSHTAYNVPKLLAVCEKLARQALVREGGRVEKAADGTETLVIPVKPTQPSPLELSWSPGPIADSKFTDAEKALITAPSPAAELKAALNKIAPGWSIAQVGPDMEPGWRDEWRGRQGVLLTHPLDRNTPCVISRKLDVPAQGRTTLRLAVSHYPEGDWDLVVRADMRELLRQTVGPKTAPNGWLEVSVDLSEYAGKTVLLELYNQANGWAWEAGYWQKIAVETAAAGQ